MKLYFLFHIKALFATCFNQFKYIPNLDNLQNFYVRSYEKM